MSPKTKEQFKKMRESKKQLILDVSLDLFANKGFHNTSTSQIAKQAGISKGLIYNYFSSKNEILTVIIDKGFEDVMKNFDVNKDGVLEEEELQFYLETSFDQLKENVDFWRLYFRIIMQTDVFPTIKEKMAKIIDPFMAILIGYFKKQGYEDPETEAMLFGALLDGISIDYVFTPELYPIDRIKNVLIKRYCNNNKIEE